MVIYMMLMALVLYITFKRVWICEVVETWWRFVEWVNKTLTKLRRMKGVQTSVICAIGGEYPSSQTWFGSTSKDCKEERMNLLLGSLCNL